MPKPLTIRYNHFDYSIQLKNFMNTLLAPFHKSPLKTLHLITLTFLDLGKPILCELARQLPLLLDFKYLLKRLWRFFSKSRFTLYDAYAGIIPYFLKWLSMRKYLEIIVDWTKIGNYWVLSLSIPYKNGRFHYFGGWLIIPLMRIGRIGLNVSLLRRLLV